MAYTESAKIVLISVCSPILCGLYINHNLCASTDSKEQTSIALPCIFEPLLPYLNGTKDHLQIDSIWHNLTQIGSFHISHIYYAIGPGSFSALKLTHIFLHTLAEIYNIKLYGIDSFYFKKTPVIKAFGNMYFYKDDKGNINLCKKSEIESIQKYTKQNHTSLDTLAKNGNLDFAEMLCDFKLPKKLNPNDFSPKVAPLYILPPV